MGKKETGLVYSAPLCGHMIWESYLPSVGKKCCSYSKQELDQIILGSFQKKAISVQLLKFYTVYLGIIMVF